MSMTASSTDPGASASNTLQAGLKLVATRLADTPLDALAHAVAKDDSQVSRIRSGELGAKAHEVIRLLYAAGLKVVPADRVCVQRETYAAISTIAAKAMANTQIANQLMWDDE